MNKRTHRLVFDRRRGMRVPAAEHVRSAGKAGGGQSRAVAVASALTVLLAANGVVAQTRGADAASGDATRSAQAASATPATRNTDGLAQIALDRAFNPLPTFSEAGNWLKNDGKVLTPFKSADGKVLTVKQIDGVVILNWDTFDVGSGHTVKFDQPDKGRALNRVDDVNASVIQGTLTANGEVIIENRNGVVFGAGARVDAGKLVTTALQVTDAVFKSGIRSVRDGSAVFGGVEADKDGYIHIQEGAEIRTIAGGDVIMVAPRVTNRGSITTPEGQTILAAGKTVYLYAPLDQAQRGLVVAVDNFSPDSVTAAPTLGTVEHSGSVLAEKGGTINLVGAAIRQRGTLTATTAVKGLNGGIFLQAMKDTTTEDAPKELLNDGKGKVRIAQQGGSIELDEGSVTQVLPSAEGTYTLSNGELHALSKPTEPATLAVDATADQRAAYAEALRQYELDLKAYKAITQTASDTFYRSRIDVIGADIRLRDHSKVIAPAGEVNILAADNWSTSSLYKDANQLVKDNSRIVMDAGAVVDVSGVDKLHLSAERTQLKGRLFSIELADAPVQRNGVLYRSEVLADARRVVNVGNVTGFYSDVARTAAEMSTTGGVARIQSQGAMILDAGAKVDFSGGSVVYDAGSVTSTLLRKGEQLVRIEDARPGVVYDELVTNESASSGVNNLPEQLVGQSAGVAWLAAPKMAVGATLDGSVVMNDTQRLSTNVAEIDTTRINTSSGLGDGDIKARDKQRQVALPSLLTSKPNLYASLRPSAGLLVLGNQVGPTTELKEVLGGVSLTGQALSLPNTPFEWTDATWANALATLGNTAVVSVNALNQARLGSLTVTADAIRVGDAAQADRPTLAMASGGSVSLSGVQGVTVDGGIRAAGGAIALSTGTLALADVTLGQGASLDVRGTQIDERFTTPDANDAVVMNGGKVGLDASRSVVLGQDSSIDVSAGVRRSATGALTQGTAGGIALTVNTLDKDKLVAGAALNGAVQLGGSLSGFDFKNGGSLSIGGVSAIQVGGAQKASTDLLLDKHLFTDRGFGDVSFSAAGDIDVAAGEQVKLELVNMQAQPARQVSGTASLYGVTTLEEGRRQGVKVSFTARSEPQLAEALPGLASGADIQVGAGALLDAGHGGSIKFRAGGSIDILGKLVAHGGQVSATLSGKRGGTSTSDVETYGYLKDQRIHLGDKAGIDVSGVVKSYRPNGEDPQTTGDEQVRVLGEVLAGGTVTLGDGGTQATRGQVIVDAGSTIDISGASGRLNRDASSNQTAISAAAGTLNVNSSDGITFLGTVKAQAPNASVAGGSVNISLSRGGLGDFVPDVKNAYQKGERQILVSATTPQGATPFGQGVVLADVVNTSGADRVKIKADDKVVLGAGVSLGTDPKTRRPLSEVVLNTPVLQVTDGAAHSIEAHHVVLGDLDLAPQIKLATEAKQVNPSELGTQGALAGTGTLSVNAGLIELVGDTAVQGVNKTELSATLGRSTAHLQDRRDGDIRLIGRAPANGEALSSQFSYAGDLTLRAGQVYATTLSNATVKGFATNGKAATLTVLAPDAGSTSQTPLSALGALTLNADKVSIDGVLRQPFGSIGIDVNTLEIGPRAVFDVSGNGKQVPVGRTVNGSQWVYAVGGATDASGNSTNTDALSTTVQDLNNLVVDKRISLKGKTKLTIEDTAYLNASAGGDLLAWEFKAGTLGSTDTLNRKDVFAILPNYTYDFAPHDTEIVASTQAIGTSLKAGDQVNVLSPNGVLAQSTYTLLPARYGVLPGAVLVSTTQLNTAAVAGRGINFDDGSVLVSGHKTSVGSSQNGGGDLKQALLLEPEGTFRKKSDIALTSANAFLADRARRTGLDLALPGEGGRVSLVSDATFNWAAQFNLAGSGQLSAGEFDLSMAKMVVLADETEQSEAGAGRVSMKRLNALGASSVLLGGTRVNTSDGVEVTRQASTVRFQADTDASGKPVAGASNTLSTTGELMAVAKSDVTVYDGLTIASTGADTGASRSYVVKGDGATLLVGNLANTDLRVSGGSGATGTLALGQVTLQGQAVQADATAGLTVQPATDIQAKTIGLGSQRMAIGATDTDTLRTGTLKVSGPLLERLNAAQILQLRANQSIDLYGDTTVGGASTRQVVLDAPQVLGKGTAGQQATVQAKEVTLRNASGVAAGTESGLSKLLVKATPVLTDGRTGGLTVAASAKADGSVAGQRLGFDSSTLQSTGDVIFTGTGKLDAQGDLRIQSARVTATANSKQTVQSGGLLTVTQPRDTQGKLSGAFSLGETLGAGGQLNLVAKRVLQDGLIDIESGKVGITGTGQTGVADAVNFTAASVTRVAGQVRQLSDDWRIATPGGQLNVNATTGEIALNGELDASAPALTTTDNGESGTAGSIMLTAKGALRLGDQARIKLDAGQANESGLGGTLRVDAANLAETDAARTASAQDNSLTRTALDRLLAQSANANGQALAEVDVRVRNQADLGLNTGVKAERLTLTNDSGSITLGQGSQLDATAAQGGVVRVMAKGNVTLGHDAKILAGSTREGANGGDVLLASDEGSVLLGQGSITANSSSDAQDGRIVLRARRNLTAANGVTTELGSVKVGLLTPAANGVAAKLPTLNAGQIDIEGVRVYESAARTALVNGDDTASAWGLGTINTQAGTFLTTANKQAVVAAAGLTGNTNVHVKAGAEVRSTADTFNLSNTTGPVVDLDLSKLRPGGEPIHLTVRTSGNLAINGNVSDGFAATGYATAAAKAPTAMIAGDAASYRFVAGADLGSANLTATSATGANMTVAGGKVVRTTAGSIELAAAGDIKLLSTSSTVPVNAAVYVAGKPTSPLAGNESFNTNYAWAQYTERGGRLDVRAGGSVGSYLLNGVGDQMLTQMTGNYFNHAGSTAATTAWWTALDSFRQGFGSFGGGNIDIQAGKDVRNIVAVAPTNARNVAVNTVNAKGETITTRVLKELGGGNVNVTAGGDIVGGVYMLGRGDGRLKAGGSVLKGADNVPTSATAFAGTQTVLPAGAMLGVMDGHWAVQAGQDINVSHVFNPTLLPSAAAKVAVGSATAGTATVIETYGEDTSVSLSALKGNVNWTSMEQTINRLHAVQANSFANDTLNLASTSSAGLLANVAPPVVHITAPQGDVTLNPAGTTYALSATSSGNSGIKPLVVMPSTQSDLDVYAGGNVALRGQIRLPDAVQITLPNLDAPATQANANTQANALTTDFDFTQRKPYAVGDAGQAANPNVVHVMAGQDVDFNTYVSSNTKYSQLTVNRPAVIEAGRDIVYPTVVGQNFTDADVTAIKAGRYITGAPATSTGILLSGPGLLQVQAGQDINLGASYGVITLGGNINGALPDQAAKISLQAGTDRSVNADVALANWGNDVAFRSEVLAQLADSKLPAPGGAASWSDVSWSEAQAAYLGLSKAHQVAALDRYLNAVFVARYLPQEAGKSAAYYRSVAFNRLKTEAMWQAVYAKASQAVAIKQSSDAAEEASRAAQRKALFAEAAQVADLAGLGTSFTAAGDVNLGTARVHSLASGGGTGSTLNEAQGGTDVLAAGNVVLGLAAGGQTRGIVNYQGGSVRALTGGDFLAGDQKAVIAGKGDMLIYAMGGDIDSGKGSNTSVEVTPPERRFNSKTGQVYVVAQPKLEGSGFQAPDGAIRLYAPNGEIRALDAYIKGGKVEINASKVLGGDNIPKAEGASPPPPPSASISVTPKMDDTNAGVSKAAEEAESRKADKKGDSLLTVELLGMGEEGAETAAGAAPAEAGCAPGSKDCAATKR